MSTEKTGHREEQIALFEAARNDLVEQAREAYRRYASINQQVDAMNAEIKTLRTHTPGEPDA